MLYDEPLSLQPDGIQSYDVDIYECARMYQNNGFFYSDEHSMSGGRYMVMIQRCAWMYRNSYPDGKPNIMCMDSYDTLSEAFELCEFILGLNHGGVRHHVACEVEIWHLVEDAYSWMEQPDTYNVAVWDDAPYDYHSTEIMAEYYDDDGWHLPFALARFDTYEEAQNWAEELSASTSPCVTIIREHRTCYGSEFEVMEAWYSPTVLRLNPWIHSDARHMRKG